MKKILLDTNAYTFYLLGDEKILDELVSTDIVYMSAIVIGELYAGFEGGSKEIENKNNLLKFLSKPAVEVLNATIETSKIFGMITVFNIYDFLNYILWRSIPNRSFPYFIRRTKRTIIRAPPTGEYITKRFSWMLRIIKK